MTTGQYPSEPRVRLGRRILHWMLLELGVALDRQGIWWNDRNRSTRFMPWKAVGRYLLSLGRSRSV